MKEFVEKLIRRLKEEKNKGRGRIYSATQCDALRFAYGHAIEIVNQLAEEYSVSAKNAQTGGWIPCSDRLPEDCDNRFYMCIVENHEEDLPMFCQYDEEYGFGFWHDIYDEHTLGFVDSEFKTNEELGYEKVIAWQPLPATYQPKED